MSRRIAILLSGPAGSGKDTCASALVNRLQFKRYAIADTLKDIVSEITRVPRDYFDDITKKDVELEVYRESPRDLCIRIGTGVLRHYFGELVFVGAMARRIEEDRIVVTDVRFNSDQRHLREVLSSRGYKVRCVNLVPVAHDGMTSWTPSASVHDVKGTLEHFDTHIESRHGLIGDLESQIMHYVMTEFLEELVDDT